MPLNVGSTKLSCRLVSLRIFAIQHVTDCNTLWSEDITSMRCGLLDACSAMRQGEFQYDPASLGWNSKSVPSSIVYTRLGSLTLVWVTNAGFQRR